MIRSADILPIPTYGTLHDPHWNIWGGGAVQTADGVYHLLVARWPRERGFNSWVTDSEVAWATSDNPGGPYTVHGTVIGRREKGWWDADNIHNPMPIAVAGKFYCYYTGNFGNGDWWDHRNHQRIGVAVADHPGGPWSRSDHPLLDTTPGSWDHLIANCPMVTQAGDGRFYMVYKGVSEGNPPFGGAVRMGLAIAEHPEGPFVKVPGNFFDAPGVQFPSDDNFVWYADGKFHAIVKDYGANFQNLHNEALVCFTSDDCRHWTLDQENPVLTDFSIRHADGRVVGPLARLDQPQIWFGKHGRPEVLFLAVKENGDDDASDVSYNVHIPLAQTLPAYSPIS